MLNLDTHILVFALSGGLRPAENALLERNGWSISAIVLWELAKLVQLGRLEMDLDDREVVRALAGLHVWPIDIGIARASVASIFAPTRPTRSLRRPAPCITFPCLPATG